MNTLVDFLTVATVVGSGVVTGILLIFSNTVMPSLARHPEGAATMVTINERILNPTFLLLFVGTAVACAALFVLTLLGHGGRGPLALAGCGLYLVGVFGVTAAFNVPMNDALAAIPVGSPEAAEYWKLYLERWTRWNTVRCVLGIVGTALLATALLATSAEAQSSADVRAGAVDGVQIHVGSGTFAFGPGPEGEGGTLEVFYHSSTRSTPDSPILLVVPGAGRDADDYRDAWIFADFARLFDVVARAVGSRRSGYDAFGHSMGGQILHRMAIL